MKILLPLLALLLLASPSQAAEAEHDPSGSDVATHEMPLDKPNMDNAAIIAWTTKAASQAMTFSYLSYQKELQASSKNFTKDGWESFTKLLQRYKLLDSVVAQQQIVSTQPGSPVTIEGVVFGGPYRWILRMPLLVKYKGVKETRTDKIGIEVFVERVPLAENNAGVGIIEWNEFPVKSLEDVLKINP